MTNEEQLDLWVAGKLAGKGKEGHVFRKVGKFEIEECCPDFSCCQSELLAPEWLRKEFKENEDGRDKMLMGFLGNFIRNIKNPELQGTKVYIAGGENGC